MTVKTCLLLQGLAQPEALRIIGIERRFRQQLAFDLGDIIERRLLLVDGGEDEGILPVAQGHGVLELARQQMNDGRRMHEVRRRMADHLLVGGAAGLEVGLGGIKLGDRVRPARFGLGHVGAGHLADIKAILGLPELLGQHVNIGLAKLHDGLVAHHIDIGRGGVQKRGLLRGAQAFAPGLHRGFGLADGVEILKALKDGLAEITE